MNSKIFDHSKLPEVLSVGNDLTLKSISLSDAECFFKVIIDNQNYFSKFDFNYPSFDSLEEVEKTIGHLINYKNDLLSAHYGLWNSHKLLGLFTINKIDWDNSVADVGFWLIEDAANKGYAFSALGTLVEYLFESLKMKAVTATTATTNINCQKLLEKSGFKKIKVLKDFITIRNKKIDDFLYRKEVL